MVRIAARRAVAFEEADDAIDGFAITLDWRRFADTGASVRLDSNDRRIRHEFFGASDSEWMNQRQFKRRYRYRQRAHDAAVSRPRPHPRRAALGRHSHWGRHAIARATVIPTRGFAERVRGAFSRNRE